jgi:hypothetical protein
MTAAATSTGAVVTTTRRTLEEEGRGARDEPPRAFFFSMARSPWDHPAMRRHLLLAAVVVLLAACSRVTADNYAKVEAGMTRAEVYELLGKPDDVSGGGIGNFTMSTETWRGSSQVITIHFAGEKVAVKSTEPAK